MRDFDAWSLAMLLRHMEDMRVLTIEMISSRARDEKVLDETAKSQIFGLLVTAQSIAQRSHLESTHSRVWDNGPFNMASKIGLTWQELQNELKVLRECIEADLEKRTFIFVPPPKDTSLQKLKAEWGQVWEHFPSAKYDSMEAVSCYALELNTACIFHFMRVVEFGLRGLARRMKVKLPTKKPLEWGQWQDILKEMNDHTKQIAGTMKAGPKKDGLLEFYNGALGQFYGFKDEFRNHVMHTRGVYDGITASSVTARVQDFMNKLAAKINEKGHRTG
jgi:hypothetical protein